jgi:hypothetical protein
VRLVKRTQREARKTTPVDAFDRFQQAPPPSPPQNKNKIKHTHTHPCTVRQLLIHDATTTSWDSFPENHPVNVNVYEELQRRRFHCCCCCCCSVFHFKLATR